MEEMHTMRVGEWMQSFPCATPDVPPSQHLHVFIKWRLSQPSAFESLWRLYHLGLLDEIIGH